MLWSMEPKLHSNVWTKFIQSILFLEHPSATGNSKLRRTREEELFSNGKVAQICFQMSWCKNENNYDWSRRCRNCYKPPYRNGHCKWSVNGNGVVKSNNSIMLKENGGLLRKIGLEEFWNPWTGWRGKVRQYWTVPTIPFRRNVNFSEENFWWYFLSWYFWKIIFQLGSNTTVLRKSWQCTFDVKDVKTVSIKLQITATFSVSMSGEFPLIQLFLRAKQQDIYLSRLFLRIST